MTVIATAGHVDHGKSALIRRLTGIEPDRWDEERRRGLTIDLGFAWAVTPRGHEVGFVDVPGHERFVTNMLAGVGSVPAVLLIIDASEGWRAQTYEHVSILDLLEVRNAVVALTKIDRGGDIDALRAETAHRLSSTTLAGSPIVPVSAHTGDGIDALWEALDELCASTPSPASGCARIWVDRVFTLPGAGTVATGTLIDGPLEVGATLRSLPAEIDARVRTLHRHGETADRIQPVARAAVNLAGIEAHELSRGALLTSDRAARASTVFDVELRVAANLSEPFTGRGAHRIHLGSTEVAASVRVFGGPAHEGSIVLARIRSTEPVPVRAFDRFIIRDTGRGAIVAGGLILDPSPPPEIAAMERVDALRALSLASDRPSLASALLADRGAMASLAFAALAGSDLLETVGMRFGDHHLHATYAEDAADRLREATRTFHAQEPLAAGMPFADARTLLPIADRAVRAFIASLSDVTDDGSTVRLTSFVPDLEQADPTRAAIRAMGMQPIDRRELEDRYGSASVAALLRAGGVIAVSDKIVLEAAIYADAVQAVLRALDEGPQPTTALRELLGTSRRVALPFLESLDLAGITRFDGSLRRRGPRSDDLEDRVHLDRSVER